MSYTIKLTDMGLLHPPKWLGNNVIFEGMTGSVAYGCSKDDSDMDIVGVCMPPKHVLFPYSYGGEIYGFGTQGERFDVFQQHHIIVKEWKKEIDMSIFSIVKFFQLCMENNPNNLELLFLPRRCVLHSTAVYEHIRDNRKLFLHRGGYRKNRGYAMSSINNMKKTDRTHIYEILKQKFNLLIIPTIEEINNELNRRNKMP